MPCGSGGGAAQTAGPPALAKRLDKAEQYVFQHGQLQVVHHGLADLLGMHQVGLPEETRARGLMVRIGQRNAQRPQPADQLAGILEVDAMHPLRG